MSRNKYDEGDDYALRRRPAVRERTLRRTGVSCGSPDWPGQCPGWRNCTVHGYGEEE
jgi:hypothetical protein